MENSMYLILAVINFVLLYIDLFVPPVTDISYACGVANFALGVWCLYEYIKSETW
jgi:hypothetical protein